jgi:hypothetical protein
MRNVEMSMELPEPIAAYFAAAPTVSRREILS